MIELDLNDIWKSVEEIEDLTIDGNYIIYKDMKCKYTIKSGYRIFFDKYNTFIKQDGSIAKIDFEGAYKKYTIWKKKHASEERNKKCAEFKAQLFTPWIQNVFDDICEVKTNYNPDMMKIDFIVDNITFSGFVKESKNPQLFSNIELEECNFNIELNYHVGIKTNCKESLRQDYTMWINNFFTKPFSLQTIKNIIISNVPKIKELMESIQEATIRNAKYVKELQKVQNELRKKYNCDVNDEILSNRRVTLDI